MIQATFRSARILQPVRPWFIAFSLMLAFFLNAMPSGPLVFLPDWLALVLCFWSVHEPRKVGTGVAFLFGILMDVVGGSIMGQHALAYVLLAFGAAALSRRILWFPLLKQALHVLPFLVGAQLVQLLIRLATGADFPGFVFFVDPLLAALLWAPVAQLLLLPQTRPVVRDENRPI